MSISVDVLRRWGKGRDPRRKPITEEITMYQMNPDMPGQMYAELVQSREQERLARRVARSNKGIRPAAHQGPSRRVLARRMKHTQVA
jgi:hypothetical protein